MRLICDACAHIYNSERVHPGTTDIACSKTPPGTVRELMASEAILLRQLNDLNRSYKARGELLRNLYEQAQAAGLSIVHTEETVELVQEQSVAERQATLL